MSFLSFEFNIICILNVRIPCVGKRDSWALELSNKTKNFLNFPMENQTRKSSEVEECFYFVFLFISDPKKKEFLFCFCFVAKKKFRMPFRERMSTNKTLIFLTFQWKIKQIKESPTLLSAQGNGFLFYYFDGNISP